MSNFRPTMNLPFNNTINNPNITLPGYNGMGPNLMQNINMAYPNNMGGNYINNLNNSTNFHSNKPLVSNQFYPYGIPINPIPMGMNLLNRPSTSTGEYRKVWVGKIPPSVSDTFILKLLETCGSVASWKRGKDHMDRPKGFGVCEYHTVESMLKCLRLLNHLRLEEAYELQVNKLLIIFY